MAKSTTHDLGGRKRSAPLIGDMQEVLVHIHIDTLLSLLESEDTGNKLLGHRLITCLERRCSSAAQNPSHSILVTTSDKTSYLSSSKEKKKVDFLKIYFQLVLGL